MLAKVLSDRILIVEELPRKRLINDRHVSGSRSILLEDAPASKDWIADDLEVSRRDAIPKSKGVIVRPWSRFSIHPYAAAPVVARQR